MEDNLGQKRRGQLVCPDHGKGLLCNWTKYGPRYECPVDGCTVRCWGGRTSTPCNQETADARRAMHDLFDPLWQDSKGPFSKGHGYNSRQARRHRAYQWLADEMGIGMDKAHFGMFTLEQCKEAKRHVEGLIRFIAFPSPPRTPEEIEASYRWDIHDLAVWLPPEPYPKPVACVL